MLSNLKGKGWEIWWLVLTLWCAIVALLYISEGRWWPALAQVSIGTFDGIMFVVYRNQRLRRENRLARA